MAHNRNDSVNSMDSLSSLTSISSRSSVETYESLKEEIASVEQSEIDLQKLVDIAQKVINDKFAPAAQSTFTYKKESDTVSVNLDAVMSAMLACAEECGGKSGQRYVASAIVACSQKEDDRDVIETLAALGTTWLTHLLFVFKASRSHESQPNQEPHELATPTIQITASHVGEGVGHRSGSFPDDVVVRDGYKCVLTGFQGPSHPAPDENIPTVFLEASHILRRGIGNFDKDHTSDSSAVTTFDILVNFTRIPVKKLEELHDHIDDPSNGMMLELHAHSAFDKFYWCLKKTEIDNVYALKVFKTTGLIHMPENNLVSFRDHSEDFSSGSTRKRKRTIPLPNPHYISIHATIAGILNMSGAGRFFDELLDKYKDDEGKVPPVRSWPELERVMEEEMLKESVAETLQSLKVY